MRVFVIAAMGAAVLAGCAPFQHGHYSEDVSYLNSKGDPAGTPLVYHEGPLQSSQFAPTQIASAQSGSLWQQTSHSVASNAFGAGGFPTVHSSQPAPFSQPISYSAPVQSFGIQQAAIAAPVVSSPISYAPAAQQTYVPPVQTSFAPAVKSYTPAPVQQTFVRPTVKQTFAPPPIRQTLTRASYVAPRRHTNSVLATSLGGHQVDADGYAICNIQLPNHTAHQASKFKPSYQPASFVQKPQAGPQWRF